jgi:hypothetical protein
MLVDQQEWFQIDARPRPRASPHHDEVVDGRQGRGVPRVGDVDVRRPEGPAVLAHTVALAHAVDANLRPPQPHARV